MDVRNNEESTVICKLIYAIFLIMSHKSYFFPRVRNQQKHFLKYSVSDGSEGVHVPVFCSLPTSVAVTQIFPHT
jgi:hypothetical protein